MIAATGAIAPLGRAIRFPVDVYKIAPVKPAMTAR
jgi:hypothetical protein